jgi:hypothetical protein
MMKVVGRPPLASDEDQIDPRGELMPVATKCFASEALDPVAYDRVADLPRHRDAQAGGATPIVPAVDDEVLGGHPPAASLNSEVFPTAAQADALGKALVRVAGHFW